MQKEIKIRLCYYRARTCKLQGILAKDLILATSRPPYQLNKLLYIVSVRQVQVQVQVQVSGSGFKHLVVADCSLMGGRFPP